jgi:hypothetical protein
MGGPPTPLSPQPHSFGPQHTLLLHISEVHSLGDEQFFEGAYGQYQLMQFP